MHPRAVGFLDGMNEAANIDLILKRLPPFPMRDMVYTQLIQSGSTKIHLGEINDASLPKGQFLRDRIVLYDPRDELLTMNRVSDLLRGSTNPGIRRNDTTLTKVVYFVTDILLALEGRGVPIMVATIPTENDVFKVLQPNAAVAVAGLVRAVNHDGDTVSLPRIAMGKKDAKLFEEVLESDIFAPYRLSHESLGDNSTAKERALSSIGKNAIQLQRRFSDRLELRQSLVPIVQITSKLIDTVFGKLPGTLAEIFAGAAERLNRRAQPHCVG